MSRKRLITSLFVVNLFIFAPVSSLFVGGEKSGRAAAASREPVRAKHGMVASDSRIASQVGVDVLRRGGNAVDAAVAVALALAVVYPEAGNLGGGGFMLVRLRDGRTAAIDYREMAPAAANRNLYLDAKGDLIVGEGSSTRGYRASGVPGTVAGLSLALKKYGSGKLSWSQLVEPARRLAANGFTLTYSLAKTFRDSGKEMMQYPESRRVFLNDGNYFAEGALWRQPELAATFARMQAHGPREFYEGLTARLIAADMKRNGGLITEEDLRNYAPREREPLRGTYRGHEIISMPPPSTGGVALIEMLNILEGYDLRQHGLVFVRDVSRDDRGDASRLRGSRRVSRRPGSCKGSSTGTDRQRVREAYARHDQP